MIRSREEAFSLLGLKNNASKTEVREAYRSLSKMLHPDNSKEHMISPRLYEINEAYHYLMENWVDEIRVDSRTIPRSSPRVFGDASLYKRQEERARDRRKVEKNNEILKREKEEKLKEIVLEGRRQREEMEREQRKKESIVRAMKSIKSILAARVIEEYLKDDKK
ncbi:MAG: DnaJ domain-containing protein [Lachnospiraceae bacterium]|nr:DnaJ domain-containing protein [Lachnospiraceae bacterium]